MKNWKLIVGKNCFKYRSFLPLPLILAVFFLFKPGMAPSNRLCLPVIGLILAISGQAVRVFSVGYAATGTSGRESTLRADQLNTSGLYSLVRNPLYIGNIVIFSGLLFVYGNFLAFLLGLAFLCLEYSFIVYAEEEFLKNQYGSIFLNYCNVVSRWFPKKIRYLSPQARFNWVKVFFSENDSVFNLLIIYIMILLYREWRAFGKIHHAVVYGFVNGMLFISYGVVKWFKKKSKALPG